MIDPSIHIALQAALALLFAWAAFHKLRDIASFREALANYELLPARTTTIAVMLVVAAEVSIASALPFSRNAALAAAAVLAAYTVAITINIGRGRRQIDCGCAGPTRRQPLSVALIGRNFILIAAALIASLQSSSRVLLWLDAVTIIGTVAFLMLLYAAVDEIAGNAPRIALLRGTVGGQAPEPSLLRLENSGGHASPQALAGRG